jgi:hypothetical protein
MPAGPAPGVVICSCGRKHSEGKPCVCVREQKDRQKQKRRRQQA